MSAVGRYPSGQYLALELDEPHNGKASAIGPFGSVRKAVAAVRRMAENDIESDAEPLEPGRHPDYGMHYVIVRVNRTVRPVPTVVRTVRVSVVRVKDG